MSRRDAQSIIDAPGDPLTARMWADDSFDDDALFTVP